MKHLTIGYVAYVEKTIEVSDEFYEEYVRDELRNDDDDYYYHRWQEMYQSILDMAKNVNIAFTEFDESEPCCVLNENKEILEEF